MPGLPAEPRPDALPDLARGRPGLLAGHSIGSDRILLNVKVVGDDHALNGASLPPRRVTIPAHPEPAASSQDSVAAIRPDALRARDRGVAHGNTR